MESADEYYYDDGSGGYGNGYGGSSSADSGSSRDHADVSGDGVQRDELPRDAVTPSLLYLPLRIVPSRPRAIDRPAWLPTARITLLPSVSAMLSLRRAGAFA